MEQIAAEENRAYRQGMVSAVCCSLFWGVLPIYWQWLKPIDSFVIIFYRIVMVAVCCAAAAFVFHGRREVLAPLADKKGLIKYALAGLLITANWSIYIWAVNAGFVIQTSIGYYIEPLVVCTFGIVLFKEKLSKYKVIALCFALAGVAAVIWYFKQVPLIAPGRGADLCRLCGGEEELFAPAADFSVLRNGLLGAAGACCDRISGAKRTGRAGRR